MDILNSVDTLTIKSGGMYGMAEVAALQELCESGLLLPKIKFFTGTSIGSLIVTLLAIGKNINDVRDIINSLDFQHLADGSRLGWLGDLYRLWNQFGYYQGDILTQWIQDLIDPTITFESLYVTRNIELMLVVNNLSRARPLFLNRHNTPTMLLINAVRYSCSVPLCWCPIPYNGLTLYNTQKKIIAAPGDILTDGGLFRNLPRYFNSDNYLAITVSTESLYYPIRNFFEYMHALYHSSKESLTGSWIDEFISPERVIDIPIPPGQTLNFNINLEMRQHLQNLGRETALSWYRAHEPLTEELLHPGFEEISLAAMDDLRLPNLDNDLVD